MEGKINILNWPEKYPDRAEVSFKLDNCGNYLKLHFSVNEEHTIAKAKKDFDDVFMDSCCELFIMFNGEDRYYNLETSCNGYQLFAYRKDRYDFEKAPQDIVDSIKVTTSLEKGGNFLIKNAGEWTLDIEIPASAFWHSGLKSFDGVKAKGNIYKCGDGLEKPHYLTWAPVDTPEPDYHRPEFFKELTF